MTAPAKRPLLMLIPPPLLFILSFLAALLLQRYIPLPAYSGAPPLLLRILGVALIAFAVLLLAGCLLLFLRARTTALPLGRASSLVRRGPYRISRNPMYVSLTSAYLGVAALEGALWPLILLTMPLLILQRVVIPFEEATLLSVFGAEYSAFCVQVRRWL
jgi:protein-S-isoprenylcysteine O-methyltransferase Ste14